MNRSENETPRRGRKLVTWVLIVALGLPFLFYLFEYVVPSLLPPNF